MSHESYEMAEDSQLKRIPVLRALGAKLAVIGICSFICNAILVAMQHAGCLVYGINLLLGLTALLVEALPAVLTAGLLMRHLSRCIGAEGDVAQIAMGNVLPQDEAGIAPITEDGKMWLQQFMNRERKKRRRVSQTQRRLCFLVRIETSDNYCCGQFQKRVHLLGLST
jgi:hypothetical protein